MKIACCQFDPQWCKVKENMGTVSNMLKDYKEGDIDVLILPEMAFTGYVFNSLNEIEPFLEDAETGPSVQWAKEQATRLKCFVIVGYPQRGPDQSNYNSLCCVNPKGELVATYQKTFLYQVDEHWAKEGPGFVSMPIEGLGQVGFGICMDLNPYQFKAGFYEFEFATYHQKHQTDIIFCSMAWLRSQDNNSIQYWATRLLPLYRDAQEGKHTLFVACNRTGTERGSEFAGSSCVLDISNREILIRDAMEQETGIMIVYLE